MPLVTPTPIPAYPAAPLVTDDRVTFSAKAFALASVYEPQRISFNLAATQTNTNAAYAHERANAAASSASAAADSASAAAGSVTAVNQTVADILAAKDAIQAGPVASVMGRTGVVAGLTETSAGARRDKTQLMANAPLGQWTVYNDPTGSGSDWPTSTTNGFWAVLTYGESARAVQQATQVFRGGQRGWTYQRTLHDATWSDWDRVFTGSTLIERADVRPGTVSGTITVDPATASLCIFAPSAATTVNIAAPRDVGDQLTIRIYFPVAASVAFGNNVVLPLGASLPAVAAGNILTLTFITDNNKSKWFMFIAGVHKA